MPALEQRFRLGGAPCGLGLNCEETGVSLAGVPLLQKTADGFKPRPAHEIDILMKGAYGQERDAIRLASGLQVAAEALNRGDIGRAMIATLHLRLPELSGDGAAGIAHADDILAKYDPDEPRDARGRWTTGGATGAANPAKPQRRRTPTSVGPVGQRRDSTGPSHQTQLSVAPAPTDANSTAPSRSWGEPTHLYGGRIIPVAGPGRNFPPEEDDPTEIAAPVPDFNPTRVPEGFETPGHVAGGLQYNPSRHPTLPNGEPWPEATPEHVLALLRLQPGRPPSLYVFVPRDGVGPMLSGSSPTQDLPRPEGYDEVLFVGRPQFTRLGDGESPHAVESVVEALRLAGSNEFSTILFNSTLTTIARYVEAPNEIAVESLRRPDVAAITRPSIDRPDRVVPYEILSGRQTIAARREEMPSVPGIRVIDGRRYNKRFGGFGPAWFRRLGVRPLCL